MGLNLALLLTEGITLTTQSFSYSSFYRMKINTLRGLTEPTVTSSEQTLNGRSLGLWKNSSFDPHHPAQCSAAKKMPEKGKKQKHLPHWPEPLSPLACSLLNPSLHFFCLSSKTQLSSKLPLPLFEFLRLCASHSTIQSLGLCCPTAFPGSKVKVLAGGQGFYLLLLSCSFPSQPESLPHPEKDAIMLNKNPESN